MADKVDEVREGEKRTRNVLGMLREELAQNNTLLRQINQESGLNLLNLATTPPSLPFVFVFDLNHSI
jgi:hypothetical protein